MAKSSHKSGLRTVTAVKSGGNAPPAPTNTNPNDETNDAHAQQEEDEVTALN